MGEFAIWQPRYAAQGIATFPLLISGTLKKPATRHYGCVGLQGSKQLAFKFPDFDAFAFMTGPRSRITVVDIDAPDDEALLQRMLRLHGDTPLISRTASGGFHLFYRHSGERRMIRRDPDLPVDILGEGVLAAPPSRASLGTYSFFRGTLADFADLPRRTASANHDSAPQTSAHGLIGAGGRNKALMDYLRVQAGHVDDLATLIDVAHSWADAHLDRQTGHAFTDKEIAQVAHSVFDWVQKKIAEGQYYAGTGRYLQISHDRLDQIMALGPYPLALYLHLRRRSGGLSSFTIPNAMQDSMPGGPWSRSRMQQARKALLDHGVIRQTQPPSSFHGVARYAWTALCPKLDRLLNG